MTRMWTFDLLLRMEWRCQSRLAHSLLHGVLYHLCEQVSKSKWLKFILSVAAAVPVLLLLTYQRCKVLVCLAWYFDADASRYMVYGAAGAGALVVGEQERGCEISLRYVDSIITLSLRLTCKFWRENDAKHALTTSWLVSARARWVSEWCDGMGWLVMVFCAVSRGLCF
jgi:hypothetical protein